MQEYIKRINRQTILSAFLVSTGQSKCLANIIRLLQKCPTPDLRGKTPIK